jgi:mannosyltransferase
MLGGVTTEERGADAVHARTVLDRRDWAFLALFAAVAAALCLYKLDERSIWLDEAVALRIAQTPDLRALLSDGGNMAAYYLFLKGWLGLGLGQSEWVARFPSVMFSAVGSALLYLLARRLFDRRVAFVAALLLTVNSSFVRYGQEARSYALELMIVTAGWLVLSVALERRTVRWFLLWGLLSAVAVATHLLAVLIVAAQLASLLLLRLSKFPWKALLAGLGVAAFASAPVLVVAARTGNVHIAWIPPMSIKAVRQVLLFLGGNNFEPSSDWWPQTISVLVLAILAVGWAAGLWIAVRTALRRGRSWQAWSCGVAAFWLIVPLAAATAVSSVAQSLMVPRYFIALLPASSLLLALAVSHLQSSVLQSMALGLLVILDLSGVARSYGTEEWGWRQAVNYLQQAARPGDDVLIVPAHQRMPLDYYVGRNPGPLLDYISPRQRTWQPVERSVFGVSEAFYWPSPPREAALLAAQRHQFWLVITDFTRWDASGRVTEAWGRAETFFQHLGPGFVVRSGRAFGPSGRVGVLLMESEPVP